MTAARPASAVGFDQVYRAHLEPVYRFCLSQLRHRADAEDIAADVFASALAAYDRAPAEPERIRAWLLCIARNATIDHHRRRRTRRRFGASSDVADAPASTDVEHEVIARDDLERVLAGIRQLRERDRNLVGLRVAAGLSFAEVGEVLGISERAAVVATGRAIRRLRRLYEEVAG